MHVEDIAGAFVAALEAPKEAIHNQAFNVGVNSENYQIRDLAEIVRGTVPGCIVDYSASGGPDPRNYRVDFSKLSRRLPNFRPKWNAQLATMQLYSAFERVGLTQEVFQGRKCTRLAQLKHLLSEGWLDQTLRWNKSKV